MRNVCVLLVDIVLGEFRMKSADYRSNIFEGKDRKICTRSPKLRVADAAQHCFIIVMIRMTQQTGECY